MKGHRANTHRQLRRRVSTACAASVLGAVLAACAHSGFSQTTNDQPAASAASANDLAQRVQKLTDAMERTEARLEESQRELEQMRHELAGLLRELQPGTAATESTQVSAEQDASSLSTAVEDLRERQDIVESQIATHEQAKVETVSKYPLRLHGLVLFNAFVNTNRVDQSATPGIALGGAGSTGATMRQTILGLDAVGPHLFGAQSYADLDMDFAATDDSSAYSVSLARLRTAHAGLRWTNTEAWFALDRSLLSPLTPASLTAVSQPALAWSGNLWTWNPQFGATHQFSLNESSSLRLQAALIDAGDAPYSIGNSTTGIYYPPNAAEQSRWPGVEAHIALVAPETAAPNRDDRGNMLGIGAYVAPHRALGYQYDAWVASIDGRLHLPADFELSGNLYRGLALGGLGGGAYKDYAYYEDPNTGGYYFRPLDGLGGWAQLKERLSERLEFNAAFGTDQIVAHQFRPYATGTTIAQNLVANRTFTGNVIFRPSAWFLFSLEYRYLQSTPANGASAASNIIGVAAGYSF